MSDVAFEIPSDPKYIERASARVLDALKGLNLDEGILFDVRLSLEEAIINAIKYGNNFNRALPISINYCLKGDKFEITIRDRGKGFDHTSIPDPTLNENILKQGGRGLFLIRALMDEVRFNDSGNEIKMIKFLRGGKGHGSEG